MSGTKLNSRVVDIIKAALGHRALYIDDAEIHLIGGLAIQHRHEATEKHWDGKMAVLRNGSVVGPLAKVAECSRLGKYWTVKSKDGSDQFGLSWYYSGRYDEYESRPKDIVHVEENDGQVGAEQS